MKRAGGLSIPIQAGAARYEALVGSGLLESLGERAARLFPSKRGAVIADANTAALFASKVGRSLTAAGLEGALINIAAGEASKSLEEVRRICEEMATAGLDRTSFIIALGGGVVGDVAGFAAAIYHRGIPYVQVPTTLLAQVDSAIGGKTGVNLAAGKNLLGAVHQPALVLADVETLQSLPKREFRQGFAEIIKHAIIADASLLEESTNFCRIYDKSSYLPALVGLVALVARNIEIKAAIVARDERDRTGERALLNFGHTVGHAIERAAGYGALLHGEAISLGIVAACEISVQKAGLAEAERTKVIRTLEAFDLPTKLPLNFPRAEIMAALPADKKFEGGEVRFVVTPGLGSARLTSDVTTEDIRSAVAKL